MVVFQHHADVKGVSSKGCFCRVERNPLGIGRSNFILYMGDRDAKRMSSFFNVLIEAAGIKYVVFYLNILPSVVLK